MKIALVTEYYPPYTPGGAEWSTFYLAKGLISKKIQVIVITPNYGNTKNLSPNKFDDQGVKVIRYNLPVGRFFSGHILSPIWLNNPLFWIYSGYQIYQISKNQKINLIHVQGRNSIMGAILSKYLLKIPLLITFREKMILCPYNYCLSSNRLKSCNFLEFLNSDFKWYYKNYSKKGVFGYFLSLISGIYGWFSCRVIRFAATFADQIITISQADRRVYESNGFNRIHVIYNSIDFPGIKKVRVDKNLIIYAGRITQGKGVSLLLKSLSKVAKKNPDIRLELAGNGKPIIPPGNISSRVKYLGIVSHDDLLKKYQKSAIVVQPTTTVEAFGRVALEALSRGTPVVVSDIGGLPEIVDDGVTGFVVKPEVKALSEAINKALNNQIQLRKNIQKNYLSIKQKFGSNIFDEHLKIYRGLL